MKINDLIVIIPAHNEESTVGDVVTRIKRVCDCKVVVVDDLSTDATSRAALAAGAVVLPLRLHLNAWGAMQTGFRYALKNDYQYCITFDADGQHLPDVIPKLYAEIQRTKSDVIIGSCPSRGSSARKLVWHFFRFLTGFSYQDITSGLRIYNQRALSLLISPQAHLLDYQDVGVLILLRSFNLKISEVLVKMEKRKDGCSRVFNSWFSVANYMFKSIVLCTTKVFISNKHYIDVE